ncbi:mitochondrial inner membrane protease subunit 1 [Radiomyces spectabilis]|uniref:mitochondrial inner membrane protease subunit 1 n=1 Tax=Radiomyces spectabilis TaxID=64574 RepID=UPI002220C3CC|nr:mitochondrial inner membrane protease subunit 1 [Radiomyces spectabilis]KAI8366719.1 mitochondrial inner membrane protease subunit 1 [Radiomyces spectabilis]
MQPLEGAMRRYIGPIFQYASYLVRGACFIHCFNQYVVGTTLCLGPSMLPTFNMTGDFIAVEHLSKRFETLNPGDVIVCMSPAVPGRAVMKRILGMPGDNICIDPTEKERKYINVPQGHVWVGGDNLSNSNDSRSYGPVPIGLIRGRVFAKVWPTTERVRNGFTAVPLDQAYHS